MAGPEDLLPPDQRLRVIALDYAVAEAEIEVDDWFSWADAIIEYIKTGEWEKEDDAPVTKLGVIQGDKTHE